MSTAEELLNALSHKHRAFAVEFAIDLNKTQAAIRAGYSVKSARVQGSRLYANAAVREAINAAKKERFDRAGLTANWILEQLIAIAGADLGVYLKLQENGDMLLDWSNLPEGATRVISEITQETYTDGKGGEARTVKRTKFKMFDRLAALNMLGRAEGMFTDNVKLDASPELRKVLDAIDGTSRGLPSERDGNREKPPVVH